MIYKKHALLYKCVENWNVIHIEISKKGKIHTYWYNTKYQSNKQKENRNKIMAELKLHGCSLCGYDKCHAALDFHHVGEKIFSLNTRLFGKYTNQEIADEISKCILLCANCHREVHHCD